MLSLCFSLYDPPGATQPAEPSAGGAVQTDSIHTSGDKEIDALLDRLETKGEAIKGLSCRLIWKHVIVDPVESRKVKAGQLLYARAAPGESNSRFLVHFDVLTADGETRRNNEYYAFDGRWLIERNDKARNVIHREVVRPGERRDPFRLGEGPFPMPFGQKRADILRNFTLSLAKFELGDPRNTTHLHCIPRPGTDLASKYTRVEMYINRSLELPVRIVSESLKDGSRTEVDFSDIDIGAAPAGSRFQVEVPPGFEKRVETLSDGKAVQSTERR
jgi:hypothetical protein